VARFFPEIEAGNVRGVNILVSVAIVAKFPDILDHTANAGTAGKPENHPRAIFIKSPEESQFFSQFSVVSLTDFLETFKVVVELFLGRERGSVNSLKGRVTFGSLPVGA
jgi:hypothetical protein